MTSEEFEIELKKRIDAEREKWERERKAVIEAMDDILTEQRRIIDQLRQQLLEAQEQLDYSGVHTCSSQCQRPMCKMRRELAEAQAAIAVKDSASMLISEIKSNPRVMAILERYAPGTAASLHKHDEN